MRAVALMAVGLLLAGCSAAAPDAPTAAPTQPPQAGLQPLENVTLDQPGTVDDGLLPALASMPLDAATGLQLRLGNGAGRIWFEAQEDFTLPVAITHDTMDDLDLFTDDGDGIYNETTFTFVFLFDADAAAYFEPGNFDFRWWGTPAEAYWPDGSNREEPWHGSVTVRKGQEYLLLAANNVPGYTLRLGGQATERTWALGEYAGWTLALPEPRVSAVHDAPPVTVEQDAVWNLEEQPWPPAIILARGWTSREAPAVYAGAGYDALGWRSSASPSLVPSLPGPMYSASPSGESHHARSVSSQTSDQTPPLELYRQVHATKAGIDPRTMGAGFLVFPLEPTA